MKFLLVLCVLPLACMSCPNIITRPEWNARYPVNGIVRCMSQRAQNVIIHHTYVPRTCYNTQTCKSNMLSMQQFHQTSRKWADIGYNFCIGGDGNIYEGRGWGVVAYPTKGYEFNSTNICFIGDYMNNLPSEKMLQAAINLIECGIGKGFIQENPRILGVGELIATASPGKAFQEYLTNTRLGYPRDITISNEISDEVF